MSTEAVGAYSKDIIYGQLTSPFIKKMVHINAHPSSEAVSDSSQTVSLRNFRPSKAEARVNVNEIAATGAAKAKEINDGSFPPDPANTEDAQKLTPFSSSKLVKGAIQKGYSIQEAMTISQAANSYASAERIGLANILSTHSHTV